MTHPDGEALNVYLIGDAWQDEMVDAFRSYLHNHKYTDMSVEFRGMFAASDGAASVARGMLDTCGSLGSHGWVAYSSTAHQSRKSQFDRT